MNHVPIGCTQSPSPDVSRLGAVAVWLLVAVLAWAPFPLGGAISWGAGLQELLVAACWVLWMLSGRGSESLPATRRIAIPIMLGAVTLLWALVQILPVVPGDWAHPVWTSAGEALGRPLPEVLSLNPWRTESELLKLLCAGMGFWLAYLMARRQETARLLVNAVIFIGALYVLYAFVLEFAGLGQADVFYSVPVPGSIVSGPFLLHNSFATYCGLATVAGVVRLFALGTHIVVATRGPRQLALSLVQFIFKHGALTLVATLLTFAGVVASASRAGFVATLCGFFAMAVGSLLIVRHRSTRQWAVVGAFVCVLPLLLLVAFTGDTLAHRLDQLFDAGITDNIRFALWTAASRMVAGSPWFGLGLGTFQDAYPLYASQVLPYVMDKAHCDYLEFAAGLGLPAAIAWWLAILWLFFLCLRGLRTRHRNRWYPLMGIGATILIAVHSVVDFSLQIPAVALTYAVLLGIGVAQAFPTRPHNGQQMPNL